MFRGLCWDFCADAYREDDGSFVDERPIPVPELAQWLKDNNVVHNEYCQDQYPLADILSTATAAMAHRTHAGELIGCAIDCDLGLVILNTPDFAGVDWEEHACEEC